MKKLKVFIVDDDKVFAQILRSKVLNMGEINVSVFYSGSDCVLALNDETPDIIFLDLMMEGIDGMDTLKIIKKFKKDINIVIISSREDFSIISEMFMLGANDFIVKGEETFEQIKQVINDTSRKGVFSFLS